VPELARPEDAALVEKELAGGADIVKLFTGSWATPRSIVLMPLEVAKAAAEAGHRRGKLVFAHPSNSPGARVAIEAGVDVLAHTFPTSLDGTPWDRALPGMMPLTSSPPSRCAASFTSSRPRAATRDRPSRSCGLANTSRGLTGRPFTSTS
jgi:hypothetical protein